MADWTYVAGWRKTADGAPLGRLPKRGDQVAIDATVPVTVPAGVAAAASCFIVGSKYGTGHTSTIVFEDGASPAMLYASFYVGDAVGATGTVHLAGGSFAPWGNVNNVTNVSYLRIGEEGVGYFTNTLGAVHLRECCILANKPGSFGRYVHDGGTFHFCFGGKPFVVGNLGWGELEVRSGIMTLRDLLIGGTNTVRSMARIEEGATLAADGIISVGGFTNRMNASQLEYPNGSGSLVLRGGTLQATATSGTHANPLFRVGAYSNAWGEVRGWGEISDGNAAAHRIHLGIGNGALVADGEGSAHTLDLTDLASVSALFGTPSNGWYAVRQGALALPPVTAAFSATGTDEVDWGCSPGTGAPDLVNGAHWTLTGASNVTYTLRGTLLAPDRTDVPQVAFPNCVRDVLAYWQFDLTNETDSASAFYSDAAVTFRYPSSACPVDSDLVLYRFEGGAWREIARMVPSADGLISASGLTPLEGENALGTFALVTAGARLTFRPYQTTGTARYWALSAAANWLREDGTVAAQGPQEGDELVFTASTGNYLAAQCSSYVGGVTFAAGAGNDNVSHRGFSLCAGGPGLVSEVAGGMRTLWASLYLDGTVRAHVSSDFNFTGAVSGRSATQPGRLVKEGTASVVVARAGSTWEGATIREGCFVLKSAGTVTNLNFHFDGSATSAYLMLSNDLALAGGTLSSSADLPRTAHGVSDGGRGYVFSLTGLPVTVEQRFTGGFYGGASFRFAPEADDRIFTFAHGISSSTGCLEVVRGTVRFCDGAVWEGIAELKVGSNAHLAVESGAQVAARRLFVAGVEVPPGVYATNTAYGCQQVDWITGGGAVGVGGAVPKGSAEAWHDTEGWYTFGNANWTLSNSFSGWLDAMEAPDFAHLYFSSESKVRFKEGWR